MKRTEFRIPKMDCPAEEQLVRMKLQSVEGVQHLRFDLPARKLEVFHSGGIEEFQVHLEQLDLGAVRVAHEENVLGPDGDFKGRREIGPLVAAFSINATLFVAEFVAGLLAYSLGLIADSFDMLADAIVYGMALAAVGGPVLRKKSIARLTGYFQGFLACAGLAEVIRRVTIGEGIPDFRVMIILSCIALAGNSATLLILNRSRHAGVHMQAAWICTSVDVQVNLLVILAGVATVFTRSPVPDILVGGVVFLLVANGARKILALSR